MHGMNNSPSVTEMETRTPSGASSTTRRDFIKHSAQAVAGAALASTIATRAYAAENNTLKLALIGCGGRGGGAIAQALSTEGPTKLWAVADFFEHRAKGVLNNLKDKFQKQLDVPPDRVFVGLDGYKKAIDSLDKGSVVLLATPPAFRSIHFEYAVQKGMHVFMEKSFAVDAPGIRRVLRTGELASRFIRARLATSSQPTLIACTGP